MALTTEQFKEWLDSPDAIKCMLVEVVAYNGVSDTTIYLSNRNYVTKGYEIPSNTTYLPLLRSGITFRETISLEGDASISYGDIQIDNTNGEYDDWANYIWVGRPISIYIGDVTFDRADFTKIFSGVLDDIGFSDKDTINLSLRDIIQRLNTPVTDTVLGVYGTKGAANQNKDQIRPLVFGEVHNITPLLIDDAELEYMVHNGTIERIIEVRDNGVPVQFTPNLSLGTFKLTAPAVGLITCSVQGDKYYVNNLGTTVAGYKNTVTKIIQRIITGYGKLSDAIIASEMDLTSFENFDAANQQAAGVYISDRSNIISVCQELAKSIGGQLISTRLGVLKLVKVEQPTLNPDIVVNDNYILQNSLSIAQKVPVVASIKLGYCKNWTIQTGILTGIPEEHKDLYTQEYLTRTVTDTTTKNLYKLSSDPVQKNTLLLTNSSNEIDTEATRLLNIYKTPRFVYKMECTSSLLGITIGDMISLYHYRFGLVNGKAGQVVGTSIDWDRATITLEVLV